MLLLFCHTAVLANLLLLGFVPRLFASPVPSDNDSAKFFLLRLILIPEMKTDLYTFKLGDSLELRGANLLLLVQIKTARVMVMDTVVPAVIRNLRNDEMIYFILSLSLRTPGLWLPPPR